MEDADFKNLLSGIEQARAIHSGKKKPCRVFKFSPIVVKEIRSDLHKSRQSPPTCTFSDVTTPHTIAASFIKNT